MACFNTTLLSCPTMKTLQIINARVTGPNGIQPTTLDTILVEETTLDESVGLAIPIFDPRSVAQEEERSRMADVGLLPFPGRP